MEILVKENGTKEPLLFDFSKQQRQAKKDETTKSRRLRRCKSAPASDLIPAKAKQKCVPSQLPFKTWNTRPTLTQASLILSIYLGVGMICFFNVRHDMKGIKTNSVIDALYFCVVTMTTVGYGDLVPSGTLAKLFACAFVFAGMALAGLLLNGAADYLVEKQEMLLIKAFHNHQSPGVDEFSKESQINKAQWKLLVTLATLLALMVIGMVVLHEVEGLDILNSFYCLCSTITTLGYGDQSFSTEGGRIFAVIWILVSTLCLAQFFFYLAELRTEDRQRSLVQWVVTRRTTISDLEAADLDSDGVVSDLDWMNDDDEEMTLNGEIEAKLLYRLMVFPCSLQSFLSTAQDYSIAGSWEDDDSVIGPKMGRIEGIHSRITTPLSEAIKDFNKMHRRREAMGSQGHKRFGWKPPHEDTEDIDQLCWESYKSKDEEFKRQLSFERYREIRGREIRPQVWIHKLEWYFMLHPKDGEAKIKFAALHLEGIAYEWWLILELDIQDEGSIKEYNKEFLKASLLVRNLGIPRQVTMFVDGLKEDIKEDSSDAKLCVLGAENWKPGHKCANSKQIKLIKIADEDEDGGVEEANEEDQGDETIEDERELNCLHIDPYISLSTITGLVQPQTIRVRAHMKRYALMALIDLGLAQITCLGICKQVPIQIGDFL
eukprot:Gb_34390 [translate_table: standard]